MTWSYIVAMWIGLVSSGNTCFQGRYRNEVWDRRVCYVSDRVKKYFEISWFRVARW